MGLPKYLEDSLDVWRVVAAGLATLTEVESSWTLADMWDANLYLDLREDAEFLASKRKP